MWLQKNKMKKFWLSGIYFVILLLSFSLLSPLTFALEKDLSASPSSEIVKSVNYELPYPGLLPDSPLYFLRTLRDKTVSLLISDPLKKAEFNLLQADKRLNAGIYLVNKNKDALALTTISKAENYFSEAIDKLEEAKNQGRGINGLQMKMKDALVKHELELRKLSEKVDKDLKSGFENEVKRVVVLSGRLAY